MPRKSKTAISLARLRGSCTPCSPNQVLMHAARAAAEQLNKPLCGRAHLARRCLACRVRSAALWAFCRRQNAPNIGLHRAFSYTNRIYFGLNMRQRAPSHDFKFALPDAFWPAAAKRQPRAQSARRSSCPTGAATQGKICSE